MHDLWGGPVTDRIEMLWTETWDATLTQELELERSGDYQPHEFYTSGRASKDFPNKEDPSWWRAKGPGFVKSWVKWRDNSGLKIWTTPDGEPAIELDASCSNGDLEIVQIIDRVMVDEWDNLYIVDLKSGSSTPAWPRQLAMNNLGILEKYGYYAKYGGFWSARKGGIDPAWSDLRIYTPEWLWEQVRRAREIRDRGLFVAQPTNLCKSACSVSKYCVAVGGPLSLSLTCNSDTRTQ